MSTELERAIHLIKSGAREQGQGLLAKILARDPGNEAAWLWMSGAVDDDEQRRYCLARVLQINPGHSLAREALARMQPPPATGERRPEPEPTVDTVPAPAPMPEVAPAWKPEPEPAPAAMPQAEAWPGEPWEDKGSAAETISADGMAQGHADFVVAQLGEGVRANDVIYALCERSGLSWSEAEALVRRLADERGGEVVGRRRPFLLALGVFFALAGAGVAYLSASYLAGLTGDPMAYVTRAPYVVRGLILLVTGLGMMAGGAGGIWRAVRPTGEEDLLGQQTGSQPSIDDMVDIGVWLDTGSGDRDRRSGRRRGTRLF